MAGFGVGFLLPFTAGNHGIISPAAAGLVWGGLGAGLGALAGWGISREDDGSSTDPTSANP
jgi:hypothetical protein